MIEDLLSDCYQREGITTQQDPPLKKEHPTNPLLNKYYYIHRPEQAKTMETEVEKSEVRVDASDIQVSKMNQTSDKNQNQPVTDKPVTADHEDLERK